MDSLFHLNPNDPWARALATLIDSGVKGILLLCLATAAVSLMRKSSAAARHLVWALSLCGLLLLPLLSIVVPKWQLPILPHMQQASVSVHALPAGNQSSGVPPVGSLSSGVPTLGGIQSHEPPPATPRTVSAPIPLSFWVLSIWLAVALITIAPLIIGILTLARMVRKCALFQVPNWDQTIRTLAASLGLNRPVRVLQSGPETMPMATGLLRAAILLPAAAADWDDDKRRSVLLHELAHVKRRDCLTHALARIAVSIHWFNPLAWFALRRMRIERERACDDLVLTAGERPSTYADHLLEIARSFRAGTLASAAAITMARQSQLEGRLLAVLDPNRSRKAVALRALVVCVLVFLAIATTLSAVELKNRDNISAEIIADKGSQWTAKLPSGGVVRLHGISENPSGPNTWYTPDGVFLSEAPVASMDDHSGNAGGDKKAYEVVVQLDQNERFKIRGNSPEKWDVPSASSVSLGHSGAGNDLAGKGRLFRYSNFILSKDKTSVDIRFGIADGPWITKGRMGANDDSANLSEISVKISKPYMKDGMVSVDTTVPNKIIDTAAQELVAVLQDGKISHGGWMRHGGLTIVPQHETYSFTAPLSQINHFEYQICPYTWVNFKNVSLADAQPGSSSNLPIATMPGGVTLQLLGVCDYLKSKTQWWSPFGMTAVKAPFTGSSAQFTSGTTAAYAFAIRATGMNPLHCTFKLSDTRVGTWSGKPFDIQGNRIQDQLAIIGAFPPDHRDAIDIEITLESGDKAIFKNIALAPDSSMNYEIETIPASSEKKPEAASHGASGVLQFRWVATNQERDKAEKLPPFTGELSKHEAPSLWAQNDVQLSERDVASAEVLPNSAGNDYVISLKLTEDGKKRFAEFTARNIGRQLAIVMIGQIVSAPTVNEAITGGQAQISGGFSRKQAEEIVAAMKKSNPAIASGPAGTGFGPVHERVLNDTGENCLIDFDNDRLLNTPKNITDTKAAFAWTAEQGVDAGCGDESTGLIGMDIIAVPWPNSFWETASGKKLSEDPTFKHGKSGNPVFLSARGELPVTYAFKTREGGVGILQIMEFVGARPRGVKIQYKMVRAE